MTKPRQTITHLPVADLLAHPGNIRDDLGNLDDMASSIREHGIIQPLTVTESGDQQRPWLLLAGHRRLGGAQIVGLESVPCIIRHGLDDLAEQLVVMLVENTHRRDLDPVERAQAYGALKHSGLTLTDIARRTGTQPSTVSYYLNLLDLDEQTLDDVRSGELASTDAIALVREARQVARESEGRARRGRPSTQSRTSPWFGPTHRLAASVRASCDHRDRRQVGASGSKSRLGCGPCWEAAIVTEHLATRQDGAA